MANIDYAGESATQAIYNNEWAPYRAQYGATTALSDIDFYCGYGCPAGWQSHFWQDQFSSLYVLDSIGMSYYHAIQVNLKRPSSHGFQMDVNYTFSHSIDMGSDAERNTEFTGTDHLQRHSQHLEAISEPQQFRLRYPSPDHRRSRLRATVRARQITAGQRQPSCRCSRGWMAALGYQPVVERPAFLLV